MNNCLISLSTPFFNVFSSHTDTVYCGVLALCAPKITSSRAFWWLSRALLVITSLALLALPATLASTTSSLTPFPAFPFPIPLELQSSTFTPTVTLRPAPSYTNPSNPPDGVFLLVNFWNGNQPVPSTTQQKIIVYGPNQPKPFFGWQDQLRDPWVWCQCGARWALGEYKLEALVNNVYVTATGLAAVGRAQPPQLVSSIAVAAPTPRRVDVRFTPAKGAGVYVVLISHNNGPMIGYRITRQPSVSFDLDEDKNPEGRSDDLFVSINALSTSSLLAPANNKLEPVAVSLTNSLVFGTAQVAGNTFRDISPPR